MKQVYLKYYNMYITNIYTNENYLKMNLLQN